MDWFEDVFGKWVVRKRWWIIFATLFIVFVARKLTSIEMNRNIQIKAEFI